MARLPDDAAALLPSLESLPDIDSSNEAIRSLTSLRHLATTNEPAFLALCDHGDDDASEDDGCSCGGLDLILTGALACLESFPSDDEVIKRAMGSICDVSFIPSNRRRMAEYEGLAEAVLDAIVTAVVANLDSTVDGTGKKQSEALQTEGCAALSNLLAMPSAFSEKISSDRAVDAARAVSRSISAHRESAAVVEAGCAALRQILRETDNPSAVAAAAHGQGLSANVARCIESNPDAGGGLHVHAVGAACSLFRSAPPPSFLGDDVAAANGAVSAVCASLLRHGGDQSVAQNGLESLDRLLGFTAATSSEALSAAADSVARFNGVSAVTDAMAAHPFEARVQGTGCDVLAKLGSHVRVRKDCDDAVTSAVEAILAAMSQRAYKDVRLGERSRESACRALCKLFSRSPSPPFCSCVVRSGGIDALLCAVRDHLDNASLLWEALEALLFLLRESDECRVQLRGKGEVQTLLYEVSRRHPQKAGKVATDVLKAI
eukprot:CAMPEP_0113552558 /NCGR_PEP_ID=MMETSP0015_2-20120614/15133_1 /TAXON_ID=2838 /ORGANISM="Odontella" /LENGTH=490 /DNA_ID=CAMNT_0000453547 /DNA_START=72 /DNA_END=1544 /DNA_ORIENTATION=+ /assembly_acc=CAM_ASM_000160